MAFVDKDNKLWKTLQEIAADEDLLIYDIERVSDKSLRIFVEKKTETNTCSVTSDDCAKLCRRLMLFFQVEGEDYKLSSEPELEVSSPGVNRHLRLPQHYKNAVEQRIKIKGVSNGQNYMRIGVIKDVQENNFSFSDESSSETINIAFSEVRKANIEYKF